MRTLLWINAAIFALSSVAFFVQRRFVEAAFLVFLACLFVATDFFARHEKRR